MVESVIKLCAQAGVSLTLAANDNIDIHAPEGALTPDLITLLRNNKPQLISWLKNQISIAASQTLHNFSAIKPIEYTQDLLLSYPQEGIWLTDQIDGSIQYHLPRTFEIIGNINSNALDQSFKRIVERHTVLRSVYRNND